MTKKMLFGLWLFFFLLGIGTIWFKQDYVALVARKDFVRIAKMCANQDDRSDFIACWRKNLLPGIDMYGPAAYMRTLDTQSPVIHQEINRCHDIAHVIGRIGVTKNHTGLPDASFCSTSLCGDGCFHGVMEATAGKQVIGENVEAFCANIDRSNARSVTACYHGIGHGIASLMGDITKSLSLCNSIEDLENRGHCVSGAFMELYQAPSPGHTQVALPPDVSNWCGSFDDPYASACHQMSGALVFHQSGNWGGAVQACNRVPRDTQNSCFTMLGGIAYNQTAGKPADIFIWCQQAGGDGKDYCLFGAIQESVFSDAQAIVGTYLCGTVDRRESSRCYRFWGQKIEEGYGKAERRSKCAAITGPGKYACLGEGLSECTRAADRKTCLRKKAKETVQKRELTQTLELLKYSESDPVVSPFCHEFTHYLGNEMYKTVGDVQKTLTVGAHICYGGYYHGVLESFLATQTTTPKPESARQLIQSACGDPAEYEQPILYTECLHGVGHGMMLLTSLDLTKALGLCDSVHDSQKRSLCYGGVFMEYSSSTTRDIPKSLALLKENFLEICERLAPAYQQSCYMYQSTAFMRALSEKIGSLQWDEVIKFCRQIPDAHQGQCFFVMGTNLPSVSDDFSELRDTCMLIGDFIDSSKCIEGVVESLSGWYINDATKLTEFCATIDERLQPICYKEIGKAVTGWSHDKQRNTLVCDVIGDESQRDWCLTGVAN